MVVGGCCRLLEAQSVERHVEEAFDLCHVVDSHVSSVVGFDV